MSTTTMTIAEMRAADARGETQSDFERIRREVTEGIEPTLDDDSPDASKLMRAEVARQRRKRGGQLIPPEQRRVSLTLRIRPAVAARLDRLPLAARRNARDAYERAVLALEPDA